MSRSATVTDITPRLTPSAIRIPERRSVSLDRRFDVSGAPMVADRLRRGDFEPVDAMFWVSMDVGTGEGRWSVYLWGKAGLAPECPARLASLDQLQPLVLPQPSHT